MSATLPVRRLLIDLKSPIPRHWHGGDPFRTALMNALSMSFPVGEQFFIDSVRDGIAKLPASEQLRFADEVEGFIAQEATHRHIHGLFNAHLEQQGYVNTWQERARVRAKRLEPFDVRHRVGITAAYEHYTAILAEWLLRNEHLLADAEPRLRTMWLWHSVEETEHRSTAFDVYMALGGNHQWRVRWFIRVSLFFITDVLRQTARNLHKDGELFKWRTLSSAAQFLFGHDGLLRGVWRPWKAYFSATFHPSQERGADRLRAKWLDDHHDLYRVVGS